MRWLLSFSWLSAPAVHDFQVGLTGAVLAVWLVSLVLLVAGRRRYLPLADMGIRIDQPDRLPMLSVIVPACNEAAAIERAMSSLLSLDYPNLEIIAVNDRSTDATGEILDRLAAANPLMRVIHIDRLPPGWLGKNHALQAASEQARGEWLLFTDADVVLDRQCMLKAVSYAVSRKIDHLVLSPECETRGFWERLFVSYFGLMFCFKIRPWDVSDRQKSAYVGLGAFNMVRAAAYHHFGGHRALPMEVADDMKLGKVMKRNGFSQELLDGRELVSVRWVIGLRGIVEGLTKNAFAGLEFRLSIAMGAVVALAVMSLYPVAAIATGPSTARMFAAANLGIMVLGAAAMRKLSGAGGRYGLAYPLASLILIYIVLRSTWRAYRQDGILWRGTLYPLDELRRGVV